ncbi:hypothetical protein J4G02_13845 [Candidatus Poribacteria bacterium]|nr:hypothetical protein [Candidatus Poribacteria bacterium]
MKIERPYSYRLSTLAYKFFVAVIVLCMLILLAPSSFAAPKRVVVLYFEDHSRFDHPTGCGCIPTGPFSGLFGGRNHHKKWYLKEGFTELLNRKLEQSEVYEPVSQDEMLDAMAELGLSRKALSDPEKRAQLAKTLKVQALVIGDIRKFNQERVKANAGRLIRQGGAGQGATASYVGGVQLRGSLYIVSIQLEMQFFGTSGTEIDNPKIAARKQHQLGGLNIGPLDTVVTEQGTELQFGQSPGLKRKPRPIVAPSELNRIEFGSERYTKTLFGMATDDALHKIVLALRENIGPALPGSEAVAQNNLSKAGQLSPQPSVIQGSIVYVDTEDPENTYINVGSDKGAVANLLLKVYTIESLTDPDTGELLGVIPKQVGVIKVVEVQTDRLSRVEIIEGFGTIKKGDRVKQETATQPESE